MSALAGPAAEADARRRRARADARRRLAELERVEGDGLVEYERLAAAVLLGDADEAALLEVEADLDRIAPDLRRLRAALAYLAP